MKRAGRIARAGQKRARFAIKIKKKIPKYALAQEGGIYDCGSISRISNQLVLPLTMVEKQLCAAERLYGNIVKLKPHPQNPRSLEGNIIVFRHDGPESVSSITSQPCMDVFHYIKFLHVLKETHYCYESIQINQNSLSTNEMDNFGARAPKLLKIWTI